MRAGVGGTRQGGARAAREQGVSEAGVYRSKVCLVARRLDGGTSRRARRRRDSSARQFRSTGAVLNSVFARRRLQRYRVRAALGVCAGKLQRYRARGVCAQGLQRNRPHEHAVVRAAHCPEKPVPIAAKNWAAVTNRL